MDVGTTGSPVGILVGLGRARSELSVTRRVAGPDGLSNHTKNINHITKSGTRLREALYSTDKSSLGSGLSIHTVTEYDIIRV